ncbi:hypothetical protein BYT27DRAFT_6442602 [Phlegmacium glaucopus]|nr:hypothetical protein BYT27DRAFT_6442602 [Phlegmacium glaucopus]
MEPVNPKKNQENPSQEIRSNRETAHQAVELKKIERHKLEKVDPQQGYNPSTRPNSFTAQLITKSQDISPDRYTNDQDEYAAQRVHNNMHGQHPTKVNLSAPTKHREKEEIEPREVKPQDVVSIKSGGFGSELSLSQQSFKPAEDRTDKYVPSESKTMRLINTLSSQKMCVCSKQLSIA